ncbi:HAD-IA family hydrolase [Paenibacillus sp. CF384]|uniref:HAD-IA family hydrolase n=1 Tax=Paenibacillus sp. CF384 TaxID=1884382 RepID=UPI000894FA75|nr:HAD-IA family hydrolase [Paenibacillus sp. CF384]SDX63360.1 putative hydrolase of the HAD superfamily [Paenibacillus sp. CF384]
MSRPQLVLDVGGVLLTNFTPEFWEEVAADRATVSFDTLRTAFKRDIREDLWTGRIEEGAFWEWLGQQDAGLDVHLARAGMAKHLKQLPAFHRIPAWSEFADIHLLSNHRHEWIAPLLEPIRSHIASVTISSEAGCCKPDLSIYRMVRSRMQQAAANILFVDDAERNLRAARELEWETLLADRDGAWVEQVEARLRAVI